MGNLSPWIEIVRTELDRDALNPRPLDHDPAASNEYQFGF
jgi:hypothetical protein